MYVVVSHIPSDDINCPGISVGPLAVSPQSAIAAWKEHRLSEYEASCAKDPNWDPTQPDSYEGMIIDMASELVSKVADTGPLPAFVTGGEEQAYVLQVPALPESLVAEGKRVMSIGNHRGTRFYVYQRVAHVPVLARAEDETSEIYLADYDTEADALAAHPGALITYR